MRLLMMRKRTSWSGGDPEDEATGVKGGRKSGLFRCSKLEVDNKGIEVVAP